LRGGGNAGEKEWKSVHTPVKAKLGRNFKRTVNVGGVVWRVGVQENQPGEETQAGKNSTLRHEKSQQKKTGRVEKKENVEGFGPHRRAIAGEKGCWENPGGPVQRGEASDFSCSG